MTNPAQAMSIPAQDLTTRSPFSGHRWLRVSQRQKFGQRSWGGCLTEPEAYTMALDLAERHSSGFVVVLETKRRALGIRKNKKPNGETAWEVWRTVTQDDLEHAKTQRQEGTAQSSYWRWLEKDLPYDSKIAHILVCPSQDSIYKE